MTGPPPVVPVGPVTPREKRYVTGAAPELAGRAVESVVVGEHGVAFGNPANGGLTLNMHRTPPDTSTESSTLPPEEPSVGGETVKLETNGAEPPTTTVTGADFTCLWWPKSLSTKR